MLEGVGIKGRPVSMIWIGGESVASVAGSGFGTGLPAAQAKAMQNISDTTIHKPQSMSNTVAMTINPALSMPMMSFGHFHKRNVYEFLIQGHFLPKNRTHWGASSSPWLYASDPQI